MSDFNEFENIAGDLVALSLFQRLTYKYGLLNVLIVGALSMLFTLFLIIQGFVLIFNHGYTDTWNKLKPGDSIFADKNTVTDTAGGEVTLYRLIRPINGSDINKLKIEDWRKTKMKMALDTTKKKHELNISSCAFQMDSMLKYKTAFLGTFIKKDSLDEYSGFGQHWYAITPNFKLVNKKFYNEDLPDGYMYASKDFYINAQDARLTEVDLFTKK